MRLLWLAALPLGGCVREACVHTQQAVAARTYDCTGDWELAEGRARRLEVSPNVCLDADSTRRACPQAIEALSCQEVASLGDDLGAWMAVDPSCADVFSVAGGPGTETVPDDTVTLAASCDCPPATVGPEIEVLLVNERDEDLRVYAVPPDDCGGDLQSTAWTLLANGVGNVSLPEGGVYHMVPVRDLTMSRGCFTAVEGVTVRVTADR